MRSAFAVFLRGFTLPFGATSGRRIVFNGDDGSIQFFDGAGNLRIQLGGATPLEEDSVQLSTGDSGEAGAAGDAGGEHARTDRARSPGR